MKPNTSVRNVQVDFCSMYDTQESAMDKAVDPFGHLRFRVLEEVDPDYGTLVARCLETGTTVTADDAPTLRKLITTALQLHIKLAAESANPEALYHQRATPDVWVRYDAVSVKPDTVRIEVNLSSAPRREVTSEISIAQNIRRKTA